MTATPTPLRERLERSLAELGEHRQTHVVWRDWLNANPANAAINPHAGSAEFHAGVILDYDRHLANIREAIDALAGHGCYCAHDYTCGKCEDAELLGPTAIRMVEEIRAAMGNPVGDLVSQVRALAAPPPEARPAAQATCKESLQVEPADRAPGEVGDALPSLPQPAGEIHFGDESEEWIQYAARVDSGPVFTAEQMRAYALDAIRRLAAVAPAGMVLVPRDEIERAVKVMRYAAHPHPSPNADALAQFLATPPATAGEEGRP